MSSSPHTAPPTAAPPTAAPPNAGAQHRTLDRVIVALCVVAGLLAAVIGATLVAQTRLPDATATSAASAAVTAPAEMQGVVDLTGQIGEAGDTPAPPPPPVPTAPAVELEELPAGCEQANGCQFGSDTTGLIAEGDAAEVTLTDEGAANVVGMVKIPTAGGEVELPNADIDIEVDEDGNIVSVEGTTDVPLPTTGVFSAATIVDGARAEVGYDWGYNLTHLGAYVNPNRQYYYFTFADTFAIHTGFDQLFGDIEGLPVSLSAPGDVSVTIVLDPLDPFFYIGGACPSFKSDNDAEQQQDRRDHEAANVRVGGDGGEDCGFGASLGGYIPFTAQAPTGASPELASFDGNLVIHHNAIPLHTGVFVDGEVVVKVTGQELAFGANGDIYASVPLVKDVLDFSFPLGEASAGYQIGGSNPTVDLFISGSFDSSKSDLLPEWLPFELPPGNSAAASARLVIDPTGGSFIGAESYVEVSGEMNLGANFLANLTGATPRTLQTTSAMLRIDADGARLQGSTSTQLLPNVRFGGEATVDAYISPAHPSTSYVELVGSAGIGDVLLDGEVLLRLDANGVVASGVLTTPVSQIEVSGIVSADEVTLRGHASLSVGTSDIAGLAEGATQSAADARAEADRLDAEIDRLRGVVIAEREAALAALREELFDAEGVLVSIGNDISDTQRAIDRFEDDLDEAVDEVAKFLIGLLPRGLREKVERLRKDIDEAEDALDDLLDERTRASRAIEAAERALADFEDEIARFAVDLDVRIAPLVLERETLELYAGGAEGVAAILSIDARVQAEIDVVLSTTGLSGSVTGQVCNSSGCLDLVGGSVAFDPLPEACFTIAGLEGCIAF